jgi:ribA/ribD-fused uncharacterized protein
MGYGEYYKDEFWKWFGTLTEQEQQIYKEMFPEPKLWRGVYNDVYDYDDAEGYGYKIIEFWNKNGTWQYSRKKLMDENDTNEFLFFWKPNNEVVNESCLGQWQLSKFIVEIDEYICAEQYMMAEKARLFEDEEVRNLIMKSMDPKEMKVLGKKVKNFDQTVWDKVKYSIVLNGNYYKFSQNKNIRNYLLSTGNKVLVEASPLDTIWGIGLGKENEKANNPNTWRGKNLLGFALMEVRDEVQNVYKNYDIINWKMVNEKYEE